LFVGLLVGLGHKYLTEKEDFLESATGVMRSVLEKLSTANAPQVSNNLASSIVYSFLFASCRVWSSCGVRGGRLEHAFHSSLIQKKKSKHLEYVFKLKLVIFQNSVLSLNTILNLFSQTIHACFAFVFQTQS